jgi:hypothetical protein
MPVYDSPTFTTTSRSAPASKLTQAPFPPVPPASRLPAVFVLPRHVPNEVNARSKLAAK